MSQSTLFSYAMGIGTQNRHGDWLEVYYPTPIIEPDAVSVDCIMSVLDCTGERENIVLDKATLQKLEAAFKQADRPEPANTAMLMQNSKKPVVLTLLDRDLPPISTPEAYLKLQLISHRLVTPHAVNLEGLFALLPNVAWTNRGAVDVQELAQYQWQARLDDVHLQVYAVDKFPIMANYVVPTGVRIADASRVRLGAYVGLGTTIMHEGFVNFNAGTLGASMIEGRVSAGVVVGEGSDLGGGCSTMGTLSGGGNRVISVGTGCLLGANSGIGIPLGDDCTVEAGLYLTAGAKVLLLDSQQQCVETVKAHTLAGRSHLLFRRNSVSGAIECLTHNQGIELNDQLHAHN